MLRALALAAVCALAVPPPALAADGGDPDAGETDGGGTDGGAPDGSVGQGGADRDNPEGEDSAGRVVTHCVRSSDCSPGFTCAEGRCRWVGIRQAEGGCTATGAGPVLPLCGALIGWQLRRRRVQ
jgi:uncharacterized protein (TIGR03382 family)